MYYLSNRLWLYVVLSMNAIWVRKLNVAIVVGCHFIILEPDAKLNLKSTDGGIIFI